MTMLNSREAPLYVSEKDKRSRAGMTQKRVAFLKTVETMEHRIELLQSMRGEIDKACAKIEEQEARRLKNLGFDPFAFKRHVVAISDLLAELKRGL